MAVQRGLPAWGSRSLRGGDDARTSGCTLSGMGMAVATCHCRRTGCASHDQGACISRVGLAALARPAPNAAEPEGSGVVVGDGTRVVTADHVLGPGRRLVRVMVRDSDGVIHPARVLARNRLADIAVLALDTPLAAAAWRAGPVGPGLPVCAIGNAFGLGLSVTCGRVSATHRAGIGFNAVEDFIQTDAAVNPGMSGGALVDEDGALVGMLSAIFTKQSDANIGVNFAVHLGLDSCGAQCG
jgi:S1-C subfamily serine protease